MMPSTDCMGLLTDYIHARFGRLLEHPLLAPHQRTAHTRTVEMIRRRGGALLADEAGMGKSYVAAATAATFHGEGLSLEFIVPASLRGQWAATLHSFGLAGSSVLSHEALHRRTDAPFLHRSKLIVVDEAHRFRNPQTKRYRALCDRSIGQPLLLVTASPVCNRLDDLLALLRVFAADDVLRQEGIPSLTSLFAEARPQGLQRLIEELVIRRARESLPEAFTFPGVERKVVSFGIERGDEISARINELRFPLIARVTERSLLRMLLWRRLESSEAALRESLGRQRRFYRRALEAGAEGCRLSRREFLRIFGDDGEEAPYQELMFRSFWFQTRTGDDENEIVEIERELTLIGEILAVLGESTSSKLDALKSLCGTLGGARILIFTSAIATARIVYERLREGRSAAFVSSRRAFIGSDVCRDNAYVIHQFGAGRLDLLVATDLASEGLNLQTASVVIHYDLPWNPVKLDQRNGRAARIGQKASSVRAYYFVPSSRRDRRHSLGTVSRKARVSRALFGGGSGGWIPAAMRNQVCLETSMMRAGSEGRALAARSVERSHIVRFREITGSAVIERVAVVDRDQLSFDWERTCGAASCEAAGPDSADHAIENHRIRLLNRIVIPGRVLPLPRTSLRRVLESLRIWSTLWSELLSVSYSQGVERALRAASEEELTREGAEKLAELLAANSPSRPSFVRIQRIMP